MKACGLAKSGSLTTDESLMLLKYLMFFEDVHAVKQYMTQASARSERMDVKQLLMAYP
jgi:hypothetical protein